MNRVLSAVLVVAYFGAAVACLVWWAPNFFVTNADQPLQWTYRYWAVSFIPYGLLLSLLAARQSLFREFSLWLFWQALAAALLLWCTVYTFDYTPQSQPFSMLHVLLCGVLIVWNLFGYRRQVQEIERYRGILA